MVDAMLLATTLTEPLNIQLCPEALLTWVWLLDQWEKQTAESRNFDRTVINLGR